MSFVSSASISDNLRLSLQKMQSELMKAEKEVSTGRLADPGVSLGALSSRSVTLSRDIARLETIVDSNTMISSRLSSTQDAIGQMSSLAESLLSTLTASASGNAQPNVLRQDGQSSLRTLTAILNSSLNGEYLFAGVNTDVQPIADYEAAGAPSKAAFDAAFMSHFGFDKNNPAAATITKADMTTFMDTVVEPMFMGADWTTDWSSATDQPITSRIAINESASTSVSANESGFRKLAMAATMIAEFFSGNIGQAAREAVIDKSVNLVGSSVADLADLAARTGIVEQRVKAASERLDMQIDIFTNGISDLEAVDPYEASTRISTLLGQIETSYTLTARIQQLSLVRYLP
ncbi:MAG: flagellar hook-associated family protein [Rhizobiaceae bacterium]|nr:flagellar hook-associated family protein [Rhizobiaceae bacterium]MCV0407003.1 flagellar hook-associated family protein [Rhizobiaceae bacterium]